MKKKDSNQSQQVVNSAASEGFIEKLAQSVRKMNPVKIAVMVGCVVLLAAVFMAMITAKWNQSFVSRSIYFKDNYTVRNDKAVAAGDDVVATIGDHQLTNSQLQVLYWMEVQNYRDSYGENSDLDYTKPLHTQMKTEDLSWQQYFINASLASWQKRIAMSMTAKESGLEPVVSQLENAYLRGISVEELLAEDVCPGADEEAYLYYIDLNIREGVFYNTELEKLSFTQEELESFYEIAKSEFDANGITRESKFVDLRHILVLVDEEKTDEAWAACKSKAQDILDEWLAGVKTEESFAALAAENSADYDSRSNGGLYQQVYPGQLDQSIDDWCFDESRTAGDYCLMESQYGYHVVYFVDSIPQWSYYADYYLRRMQTDNMVGTIIGSYPMDINYQNIVLGDMKIG